mmetsp:Transcript_15490/g.21594  ORF Transcript_15490/g.21594 Transcript_15490/m.21594 type:complete len:96 (-) Transcript_15490:501-788(-)
MHSHDDNNLLLCFFSQTALEMEHSSLGYADWSLLNCGLCVFKLGSSQDSNRRLVSSWIYVATGVTDADLAGRSKDTSQENKTVRNSVGNSGTGAS